MTTQTETFTPDVRLRGEETNGLRSVVEIAVVAAFDGPPLHTHEVTTVGAPIALG